MNKNWYVYMLECSDGSLYTGITIDLERRLKQHNNKTGSKALRGKLPARIVYTEEFSGRNEASKRESEIKKWTRKQKLQLTKYWVRSSTGRATPS